MTRTTISSFSVHLQLLEDGGCLFDLSALLLDTGQRLCQPCTLNLYIDL